MIIRHATASVAGTVRAFVQGAYAPWIERLGREPSPMRDDYVQRIADGLVWVLAAAGAIVGIIMLRDGPEALMIPNVAVAPAAQGRGHGRRLIAFAEEEAKRRGYGEVRLFVSALMRENVALYRHLGFVEVGRVVGDGNDREYVLMGKQVR